MAKIWKFMLLSSVLVGAASLFSCDDDSPAEENDPEVITTINMSFIPKAGGTRLTFQAKDADGDGPNPIVIDNIVLKENTTYIGSIQLLNELETPKEDITTEVKEEGHEHQIFYSWIPSSLFSDFKYKDTDKNGLPIGIDTEFTTGASSSGAMEIVLKHQPDGLKKSGSTVSVGETDMQVTFNVTVNK